MQTLTSCANNSDENNDLRTDILSNNTETDISENDTSKSESQPIISSETVELTYTQTGQATDNETVSINTDILNEYMMTYGELIKKHGKLTDFKCYDGDPWYKFENGYGYYWFYFDYNHDDMIKDKESDLEYIPVDDDEPCRGIRNIPLDVLFNGTFDTILIKDIANIEGLNYKGTNNDGVVTPRAYASRFTYNDWNNINVQLILYHENKDMIDSTSEARFFIHTLHIGD